MRHKELAELWQQMRKVEADAADTLDSRSMEERRQPYEWWEKMFGQRVREWRKARNWSQEYLAEELNLHGFDMHQTTVAKIERGTRPLRVSEAVAIASIFSVPVLSVFYGPGPETESVTQQAMREHMELLEKQAQSAQERLEDAAKTVAYYEVQRQSMADAINRAALEADQSDDEAEA